MKVGELTRERIMQTGCQIWQINPDGVSCRAIARALGINHATVLYHYSNVCDLKAALAAYAVQTKQTAIIAQLIAVNHPSIQDMPADERDGYLRRLTA